MYKKARPSRTYRHRACADEQDTLCRDCHFIIELSPQLLSKVFDATNRSILYPMFDTVRVSIQIDVG